MSTLDNLNQRVSVIIRSTGERTELLCKQLVLEQGVAEENIIVIKKSPFGLALVASYEAGIAMNRAWSLCLDADVLLRPNSINTLVDMAEGLNPNVLEIRGLVLDKFFGGPREGGIHLYRTVLLRQALECIPRQNNIRPESYVLQAMQKRGFPFQPVNYLIGAHDFEQAYQDIYRKCFVQAHKNLEYSEIFLSWWPPQGRLDMDYQVALNGLMDGIQFEGSVEINNSQEIYLDGFKKLRMAEKPDIQLDKTQGMDIENLLLRWKPPVAYEKYIHYDYPSVLQNNAQKQANIRRQNFEALWQKLGFAKAIVFMVGLGFEKMGARLKNLVNP